MLHSVMNSFTHIIHMLMMVSYIVATTAPEQSYRSKTVNLLLLLHVVRQVLFK